MKLKLGHEIAKNLQEDKKYSEQAHREGKRKKEKKKAEE